jgi:hypothetical protein
MLRTRFISIAALLILFDLWSVCIACASEPPPTWIEVHSSHFTVITDAGEKRGREVALRFEQMRAVFSNLLTKDRLNQPVPLTILALKSDKSYYQAAPLRQGQPIGAPGFFLPGEDQSFIVLNMFEDEPWRAVAHDFAHMLLNYNYPPAQGWFDEGIAEYFSSIHVDNKQVEIGGDPELQSTMKEDLLGNQHETNPPKSLTELLGAQVWLSIPDLFSMKHDGSGYNEGTHHTLYYAESWMVIHYLIHEKRMSDTGTYFGLVLNQHVPVEQAIQQAFGMSADQMEQAVKQYFHSQAGLLAAVDAARIKTTDPTQPPNSASNEQTYRFPSPVTPDDSAILVKPLPDADARATYAAVQVRIPERRDAGLKELNALATAPTPADVRAQAKAEKEQKEKERKFPDSEEMLPSTAVGNAIAHRALAWDDIEHADFDAALTELGSAAALNQRDMWVRYYLSVLKYRSAQAKHSDIQGLSNMMLDLRAVLEWYPEMADAYDLLALARNEGGGPTAAMQAERAAMNLSPRNEFYVYHLAQIYIASKKWDAAEALLDRLKNSTNPQIASLAHERLNDVGSQRKYGLVGANPAQPKFEAQKSPFDVLEQDAAKRATAEQATDAGGPNDRRATKFFRGRLIAVDCSQTPSAILTVTSEGVVLKLRADDYKSLLLIGADGFSCGWRDRQVTVNYKPGGLTDGDLVSLEIH